MKGKSYSEKYGLSSDRVWKISRKWMYAGMNWQIADHLFSIISFFTSIWTIYLVAEGIASASAIILLSSISALLSLMSFSCNPGKYKTNYRIAYQILNAALVEHTDENGQIKENPADRKAIVDAINLGEQYIGKTFDSDLSMTYTTTLNK